MNNGGVSLKFFLYGFFLNDCHRGKYASWFRTRFESLQKVFYSYAIDIAKVCDASDRGGTLSALPKDIMFSKNLTGPKQGETYIVKLGLLII